MRLEHLSLTNFRSFSHLDIDIPGGIILINGRNAQGKTSLLEAVYFAATFTSFLTSQDSQIINFDAIQEDIPVSRIIADLVKEGKKHKLEIRLILQKNPDDGSNGRIRKEILVDGVKKSASQVIGLFNAVVFIPQMTRMLENGPEERRRYLNLIICQVVPGYAHHLSKYASAVTRRNALLKQLNERGGDHGQLEYWDQQLSEHGAQLIHGRQASVDYLQQFADSIHLELTAGDERMRLSYLPSLGLQAITFEIKSMSLEEIQSSLMGALTHKHQQDILRGMTSVGPHRDDFQIYINDLNLADFGSRGQVRTALQSLKLAEVDWMQEKTGTSPVLLLDETLAELDSPRRHDLLRKLETIDQAMLTTTDLDLFDAEFLKNYIQWEVSAGKILTTVS